MDETRIKWSDIVKAARETAEALNGKDWVNAGIKARHILFDLADEHERLQAAIRKHRDQKGDNRCWMDDQDLYAALGAESIHADTSLPPREEFLESCRRFYAQRQAPHDGVGRHGSMTITQLEAEVGRLTGELNRLYRIVVSDPAHTREEVAALGNRTAEATRAIDVWNSRLNLETKIMENRELRAEVERLHVELAEARCGRDVSVGAIGPDAKEPTDV
jgi:hypothetical protein